MTSISAESLRGGETNVVSPFHIVLVPQILHASQYLACVAKETHWSIDFNTDSVGSPAL